MDENKRAIYYNEEFVDTVVKGLAMKCRWQIRKFSKFAEFSGISGVQPKVLVRDESAAAALVGAFRVAFLRHRGERPVRRDSPDATVIRSSEVQAAMGKGSLNCQGMLPPFWYMRRRSASTA